VRAFLAVCNQWRAVPSGLGGARVIGLDYGAAEAGLRLSGIVPAPDLWAAVQVIEGGALETMRER